MCTHPFAKEALTLHLARSEGHERYFGCNLMHRNVLASHYQHLMTEAPMEGQRKLFKDAREQLYAADKAFREASLKGEDESTLQQYAEALGEAEADAALLRARQLAEAVQVLDAGQRAKLKELHTEAEYEEECAHHGEEECEHHEEEEFEEHRD